MAGRMAEESVDQDVDKILTAQKIVTGSCADLHNPVEQLQNSDVERSASEIENEKLAFGVGVVQSVCEGGGGRFVDQAFDLQSCEFTGVFCSFPLRVVEVSGHADHGLENRF